MTLFKGFLQMHFIYYAYTFAAYHNFLMQQLTFSMIAPISSFQQMHLSLIIFFKKYLSTVWNHCLIVERTCSKNEKQWVSRLLFCLFKTFFFGVDCLREVISVSLQRWNKHDWLASLRGMASLNRKHQTIFLIVNVFLMDDYWSNRSKILN